VVQERDVGRDIRPSGIDVLRVVMSGGFRRVESLAQPVPHLLDQQTLELGYRPRAYRVIRGRDRGAEVAPGRLESGVRLALSFPVHAHQGLEEEAVCQLSRIVVQGADSNRVVKGASYLGLSVWEYPHQSVSDVP